MSNEATTGPTGRQLRRHAPISESRHAGREAAEDGYIHFCQAVAKYVEYGASVAQIVLESATWTWGAITNLRLRAN